VSGLLSLPFATPSNTPFPIPTCASDAAAMGSTVNSEKISSTGAPRSASIMARASSVEKGLILSCRRASSTMTSGGSTSGRMDRIWPSLI